MGTGGVVLELRSQKSRLLLCRNRGRRRRFFCVQYAKKPRASLGAAPDQDAADGLTRSRRGVCTVVQRAY